MQGLCFGSCPVPHERILRSVNAQFEYGTEKHAFCDAFDALSVGVASPLGGGEVGPTVRGKNVGRAFATDPYRHKALAGISQSSRSCCMIIDFHTHVQTPEQQAAPFWQGRCPMTIENILEAQRKQALTRPSSASRSMNCVA